MPGPNQTFCLEHLSTAAYVPVAHLADLAAFVRRLREHGGCRTQYGGICGSGGHATARLLISARSSPSGQETRRVS